MTLGDVGYVAGVAGGFGFLLGMLTAAWLIGRPDHCDFDEDDDE